MSLQAHLEVPDTVLGLGHRVFQSPGQISQAAVTSNLASTEWLARPDEGQKLRHKLRAGAEPVFARRFIGDSQTQYWHLAVECFLSPYRVRAALS